MTLPRPADRFPPGVVLLLAFAAVGCDSRPRADYGSVGLASVSGTVTMDGEPLEGAVVRFRHTDNPMRYAYGRTDAAGRYSLNFNSEASGALPGPKTVTISTAATGPEVVGGGGPERVPARYNRDSELLEMVDPGGSHTFDFALTSDGEIAEPDPAEAGGEDEFGEGDG